MLKTPVKRKPQDVSYRELVGIHLSDTLLNMKSVIALEFEKREMPLSFEDWLILLPLIENDGITQKEFGLILGKDKTTVSRLVSSLEAKGLIRRVPSENDKRAVLVFLSERALKFHRVAFPLVRELDREFAQGLSAKEIQMLFSMLTKIRDRISLRQDEQMKSGQSRRPKS